MARTVRRLILLLLLITGLGVGAFLLWPAPVAVETAPVVRGPMRVTVDEDGRTRIKERYVVSAPLAGRLERITLKEGDPVIAGATMLATIDPLDPELLDARTRAEATARVSAAESAQDRAEANLQSTNAALELAQSELERLRNAQAEGAGVTPQELDRAASAVIQRGGEHRAAEFARDIARFELELARAAILHTSPGEAPSDWRLKITAPVSGRVLRVLQESAGVVQAGTPLVEVGDERDLEMVVDVLSSDAVPIRPGADVVIEHWGGEKPLHGRVRLVEPAAFTKISALGVEEQRVNVIIDFTDPPAARAGLGDAYRVEARIVTWQGSSVLKIPTGALFRHATSWAVFVIRDARARATDVRVGHRNGAEAEIISGLEENDVVIVYPGDRVRDGVRVTPR